MLLFVSRKMPTLEFRAKGQTCPSPQVVVVVVVFVFVTTKRDTYCCTAVYGVLYIWEGIITISVLANAHATNIH